MFICETWTSASVSWIQYLLFTTFSWFWAELFWTPLKKYFRITVDPAAPEHCDGPTAPQPAGPYKSPAPCFRDVSPKDSRERTRYARDRSSKKTHTNTCLCFFKITSTCTFGLMLLAHSETTRIFSPETRQTNQRNSREFVLPSVNWGENDHTHFISSIN